MIRAKVNGCGSLSAATFQGGSVNQQSHNSSQSQSQSLQQSLTVSNSQPPHEQQSTAQLSQHTQSIQIVNNITCRNGTLPKYLDTNLSHIDRVIVEIVETERTYVRDLQEIIEVRIINCFRYFFNARTYVQSIPFIVNESVQQKVFTKARYSL
jgi:hypothetical protein